MSQKTNSMIKLALVFFICLLSFSIGTYVGKKYSDNQHKLALLEPHKDKTEIDTSEFATHNDSTETKTSSSGENQALSDSEVAKIAEEFANEPSTDEKAIATTESHALASDESEIKTISAKPIGHTQAKTLPAKGAAAPTANLAKATVTATEREPSSINSTKVASASHFTVQVGSFPTENEAKKMTSELQLKGIKTTYVAASVNGQTWYRVNVGLFNSVKEAQDYKNDLLEKRKLTSAIVQKVQSPN